MKTTLSIADAGGMKRRQSSGPVNQIMSRVSRVAVAQSYHIAKRAWRAIWTSE